MKRIIASILLVATLFTGIVSMVSCGGGKAPAKATWEVPEVGYDGSEVTITFAHTMSATKLQPTLELYIEEFNKIFPNIHVEHTAVGGYDDVVDQIKTQLTAGNQPNIAYCYPDHVALYNVAKAVVPLDNLINSTIPVLDADGNQMLNADGSGIDYTSPHCSDAINAATLWMVGDKLQITGLDLEGMTIPTTTEGVNWYDDAYVCTATWAYVVE